jgi:hypothetical protein
VFSDPSFTNVALKACGAVALLLELADLHRRIVNDRSKGSNPHAAATDGRRLEFALMS